MNLADLAVIGSATAFLALALTVYRPALSRRLRPMIEGLRPPDGWLRWSRSRSWQAVAALYVAALAFSSLDYQMARAGIPALLLAGGAAVLFILAWGREFLFLMALRDEDLPGRFDKPIWAAVLLVVPPLGLFLFRSHRLAHWPEPEPKPEIPATARDLA